VILNELIVNYDGDRYSDTDSKNQQKGWVLKVEYLGEHDAKKGGYYHMYYINKQGMETYNPDKLPFTPGLQAKGQNDHTATANQGDSKELDL
jgi:hypothetical protein